MWKLCKQPVDSANWEDNEESIKMMVGRLFSFIKKILTWWSTVGRHSLFNQHSRLRFWRARHMIGLAPGMQNVQSWIPVPFVKASVLSTLLSPQINRLCDLHTWICNSYHLSVVYHILTSICGFPATHFDLVCNPVIAKYQQHVQCLIKIIFYKLN